MSAPAPPRAGRRIEIRGVVQGVGMRPFVYRVAVGCGVDGRVRNDPRGVTIEAFAAPDALDRFVLRLRAEKPPAARFDELREEPLADDGARGFTIVASEPVLAGAERRVSIPPDLATCEDCLRELRDPENRRFRYPFTNCTNCGPRFTIAKGVPYDRALTTMAPFALCADCRREYEDPLDRRFHAEPNACPRCGPRLTLLDPAGAPLAEGDAALVAAARAIALGRVVAVKGIGGFHLACDATSEAAVVRLRERKRREAKPLAVMVRELDEAEGLAELGSAERALLTGPERPVVLALRRSADLAPRREGTTIAESVAPDTALLGLFLPYSPLHHLLLAEVGRPLVLTSANLSDEPIARTNGEALARLSGIADLLLVHDREIETRADDSVARAIAGAPLLMRRSRGYAPRAVRLARPFAMPLLATGAQLKNAFCFGLGDAAVLGPHVGDLENLETLESWEAAIARFERFLETRPAALACDLHPDYLSTRWAVERAARDGLPLVQVQHHHAHVASAMAEHGLEGPVFGLAWDGVGLGDDGAPWGAELLLATPGRAERLATFRPIPLAGGDRAVKETWRIALAALDDAFGGDPPLDRLPAFAGVQASELQVVRRMIATGTNAPRAHGCGRWFDAFATLALGRPRSRYEGQLAMALEAAAGALEAPAYPFAVAEGTARELDLRPAVREAVRDLLAGRGAPLVAARFHETLVHGAAALLHDAARAHGRLPVVLSGGCFQNARLAERLARKITPDFAVYLHALVPPGDGGIALGQALVAGARLRG